MPAGRQKNVRKTSNPAASESICDCFGTLFCRAGTLRRSAISRREHLIFVLSVAALGISAVDCGAAEPLERN
jgi:hypothetical protein